jgi:hypothetical protein
MSGTASPEGTFAGTCTFTDKALHACHSKPPNGARYWCELRVLPCWKVSTGRFRQATAQGRTTPVQAPPNHSTAWVCLQQFDSPTCPSRSAMASNLKSRCDTGSHRGQELYRFEMNFPALTLRWNSVCTRGRERLSITTDPSGSPVRKLCARYAHVLRS